MSKLRVALLDVICLSLLIAGIIALWGLRGINVQEDVPATVRVTKGQVTISDPAKHLDRQGSGVQMLRVGERVTVGAGSDAFVIYPNGALSRLTGPAEVGLDESRRVVKKPPILTSVRSKLFGKKSSQPAMTSLSIVAHVIDGDVVTKSVAVSATRSFTMTSPGITLAGGPVSFALTVSPGTPAAIEVGQGALVVGFIARQADGLVPVIIPQLAARQGISVPVIPSDVAGSSRFNDLEARVALVTAGFSAGVAAPDTQGIEFKEDTSGGIRHLAGISVDGSPTVPAPQPLTTRVARTAEIQTAVVVPQLATTAITDQTIADSIPAGFPGNPKIHLLPGNVAQITYAGTTVVGSIDVVDGRVVLHGLPFSVDPPQIEDAVKKAIGAQDLPAVLSLVTSDGGASIGYDRDTLVTGTRTVTTEETVVADSLPHNDSYFETIPTPREISTDWKIVGTNAMLAGVITLLVSTLAGTVSGFVSENESRLARLYRPIGATVTFFRTKGSPLRTIGRWLQPGPFTRGVLLMFFFGAIYSFLALGRGFLAPGSLSVLLTLSFTTGFLALYGPWVRAFIARRMKVEAKVGLNPGQATIAAATVGVSRLFAFKPGLLLGSPAGLKMPQGGLTDKQKMMLNIWSLVFFALLGILTWLLIYFLPQIAVQSWAHDFFKTAKGFVGGLQDWSLAVFAVAVQRLFFGLLPMPRSSGHDIMRRYVAGWTIAFALASFIFIHTQLNQKRPIQALTTKMYITLAVVLAVWALVYLYRRYERRAPGSEPATASVPEN
ncbi:MAG: hypothetical protein HY261_04900 [Chloroflexi bacterium]|nr:hypothetical protein [Chloroflexota bacterium]